MIKPKIRTTDHCPSNYSSILRGTDMFRNEILHSLPSNDAFLHLKTKLAAWQSILSAHTCTLVCSAFVTGAVGH